MANPISHWIEIHGGTTSAPWLFLALFFLASFLMLWRLEALSAKGFEGTVLGTLVMPYCTGMGNLIFAFILGRNDALAHGDHGGDVMTNSLVNNITNMTLVLGLPAIIWGMRVLPQKNPNAAKKKSGGAGKTHELNRLSLLMTLLAVLFFTGAVWALGRQGRIYFEGGLLLIGLFLFWQCFHVFDVLKSNVRQGKTLSWTLPFDLALLAAGAYGIYISTDWLVTWISDPARTGFVSEKYIGWLSGWLMVLPNALLAIYYSWRGEPETVYASQVGDAHVSIPLCIGVYAVFRPMVVPPYFHTAMILLLGATLLHFFFVAVLGRLPRLAGVALVAAYLYFLWVGLLNQ